MEVKENVSSEQLLQNLKKGMEELKQQNSTMVQAQLVLRQEFDEFKRRKENELSKLRRQVALLKLEVNKSRPFWQKKDTKVGQEKSEGANPATKVGQEKSEGANPVQLNQPKKQQQESHVEEDSEGQHPSNPYPTKKENPNLQKKTTEPTLPKKDPQPRLDSRTQIPKKERHSQDGKQQSRDDWTDPTVIYIKGITTDDATANADWVTRYFATARIFPPDSISKVDMFQARGRKIIKVWMKSAEHARYVMLNTTQLKQYDEI